MSITTVPEFNSQEERNITTNISCVWCVVHGDTDHTDWYTAHKTSLHNPHTPRKNLSLLFTTDWSAQKWEHSLPTSVAWVRIPEAVPCDLSFLLVFALPSRGFLLVIRYVSTFPHSSSVRNDKSKTMLLMSYQTTESIGPFIRRKIRRVQNKTQTIQYKRHIFSEI